jgi:small-conductance mechanosensitive channel
MTVIATSIAITNRSNFTWSFDASNFFSVFTTFGSKRIPESTGVQDKYSATLRELHARNISITYFANITTAMLEFLRQIPLISQLAILLGCMLFGLLFRWIVSRFITRLASRTGFEYADIIIKHLSWAILVCSLIFGISVVVSVVFFPQSMQEYVHPVLLSCAIAVIGFALERTVNGIVIRHSQRESNTHETSTLMRKVAQVAIYTVVCIMILDTFGIRVTTIIATLGIGGLALALALQDTLANAFAGVYISLSRQIRLGDTVSFDGNEGVVHDIGWRTTVIKKANESLLIVPNSKLSQAIVTSFPFDGVNFRGRILIPLHADEDISRVEKIISDLIKEAINAETPSHIHGLQSQPEPLIRVGEFVNGGIELIVTFTVIDHTSLGLTRHELLKQIHSRLIGDGVRVLTALVK